MGEACAVPWPLLMIWSTVRTKNGITALTRSKISITTASTIKAFFEIFGIFVLGLAQGCTAGCVLGWG